MSKIKLYTDVAGLGGCGPDVAGSGVTAMVKKMKEFGFEPDGGPYDPNQGFVERSLPESIFTSAWMAPLIIHRTQYKGQFLSLLLPQAICFIASTTIQISIIYYLGVIVMENNEEDMCVGGDPWLRSFCTSIFVGSVFADLMETVNIHTFVSRIPSWDEDVDGPVLAKACNESGLTSFPFQKFKSPEYEDSLVKPATGITAKYRVFIYVIFIFPKFVIGVALMAVGSGHILGSDNKEDLILNTLGSIFVFEVDDIIYNAIIPPLYKYWIQTASTIHTCEDEEDTCWNAFGFYFLVPIFGSACAGAHNYWC